MNYTGNRGKFTTICSEKEKSERFFAGAKVVSAAAISLANPPGSTPLPFWSKISGIHR
jgi:hypothetical protein